MRYALVQRQKVDPAMSEHELWVNGERALRALKSKSLALAHGERAAKRTNDQGQWINHLVQVFDVSGNTATVVAEWTKGRRTL